MGCACGGCSKTSCYNGERTSHTRRQCTGPKGSEGEWQQAVGAAEGVQDWSLNPIIRPPGKLNWIVGDPTVLQVGEEIHMWTNGALGNIQHYVASSSDPTSFKQLADSVVDFGTVRPYIFHNKEANKVTLFYEQFECPFFQSSHIAAREAEVGKWKFGPATTILKPKLPWEKEGQSRVGNAFVYYNTVKGKYWLYYSCGKVDVTDSGIAEPLNFGLAQSDQLLGPYTRVLEKPMEVRGDIPGLTIIGNGSLKIIKSPYADITANGVGVALCNRITKNLSAEEGKQSGSTVSMIRTSDGGLSWDTVVPKFLGPSLLSDNWKEAYVYAFDTLPNPLDQSSELIYYNGRNGWKDAYEEAGVSRFPVEMIRDAACA
ncbi:unnamed protein product [Effrenium voratum]|uniref:Uncharacterized protein n=1 Tax=Effrenium voratum TaxID=2562239 RepID=A0AA36J501_9DINO|nr:unnamed protein product [Effrenium voratum]